jgi:DNA polymerase elongation subunit (family B)
MSACVFDIETAPLPDPELPAAAVESLQRSLPDDKRDSWRDQLSLSAVTASVVAIGLVNPDSRQGFALYDDRHGPLGSIAMPEGYACAGLVGGDEATILQRFWTMIAQYDRVITYNGRGFDVPFLMQRALLRGVTVSCNLMPPRFSGTRVHLDLMEVLTQFGATRRTSLAAWVTAAGLSDPKAGPVRGEQVGAAFREGRTREIVEYCMRDVVATAQLAERVLRLWKPLLSN